MVLALSYSSIQKLEDTRIDQWVRNFFNFPLFILKLGLQSTTICQIWAGLLIKFSISMVKKCYMGFVVVAQTGVIPNDLEV